MAWGQRGRVPCSEASQSMPRTSWQGLIYVLGWNVLIGCTSGQGMGVEGNETFWCFSFPSVPYRFAPSYATAVMPSSRAPRAGRQASAPMGLLMSQ